MRNPDTIVVNARPAEPSSQGSFGTQDIFYVLFRHKWKVLLLTLLGLGAGAAAYFTATPEYVSEARLMIKYVVDDRSIGSADNASVRSADPRGDAIIQSELQMLTSFDLVREVVSTVGATNIVKDPADPDPISSALAAVRSGIDVAVPINSTIIRVKFRHSDPAVTRLVLTNLVDSYLRMHTRIHRSMDALNDVARQVDQRRIALERTEEDLRRLKNEVGVVSLEETKRYYLTQIGNIRADILETQAGIAERAATLGILTNSLQRPAPVVLAPTNTIPQDKISEYRSILSRLDAQRKLEAELLLSYTTNHTRVMAARNLIATGERERQVLEAAYPGLPQSLVSTGPSGQPTSPATSEATLTALALQALYAKLDTLTNQLAELEGEARKIAEKEGDITKLDRKHQVDSEQYHAYAVALDKARVQDELSQGKISNIRLVETAIPAYPDYGNRLKLALGLAGGGLALGLLLAFMLEIYLDESVRRPVHVERNLRLPLFLSIPQLRLNGSARAAIPERVPAPEGSNGKAALPAPAAETPDELATYAEALRDRLMMHFQLHGLNHKPKLVGVTSCGVGAGVTTLATSLAASLSETGDGNVLYVDVNPSRGPTAQSFQKGKPKVGIRDALEQDTRDAARVQDNLYMVSLADPASGKVGVIPKTLSGLVPRMKASDYDYIIFDLPPITQTSATAKVAGLLDMTFVVIDSEKTQTDLARKATGLLAESRANVAAVLNKHRRYLPKRFDTDL